MNEQPKRKQIRIENYDYSAPGAYFVTICTANREKCLWGDCRGELCSPDKVPLSEVGLIVEKEIATMNETYDAVSVDKFCIMPDHIHLIVRIDADVNGRMVSAPTVSTVVGSMKRWVSKQIGRSIWQKSFYEHGIRNQRDYDEIWEYIDNNPLKYEEKRTP